MRKRSKLSVLLILSFFIMSILPVTAFAASFSDVSTTNWAKTYIETLADKGIVAGVGNGKFNPAGTVTRAEFATMIVNAKGLSKVNAATPTFTDVAKDAWYYGYVEAAAKAGYVNGFDGKFNPNANITREEVAKVIVDAAGLNPNVGLAINFTDAAQISNWAKGYVAVAADKKFVVGSNNKFSPKNNATRAEAAKLIYGLMVFDGKISDVPAGLMKVTETPDAYNADVLELDGKNFDVKAGAPLKIANEYVDDMRLFVEGTLVKVTLNDKTVIAIEADGNVVEGEVEETGTNSDNKATITVDGKDYVESSDAVDDYAGDADLLSFDQIYTAGTGDSYKLLLDEDGKVYAGFAVDAATVSGVLTAKGQTADAYYVVIDGTKYYTEEDSDLTEVAIKVNGSNSDWAGLLTGKMVAEIELNGSNELVKITAWTKKVTGSVSVTGLTYEFDGDNYKNVIKVGNIFIGEETTGTGDTQIGADEFRPVTSNVKITKDGVSKDLDDIKVNDSVTVYVDADGEVYEIVILDGNVIGQVEAWTVNSDNEVTSVTVAGVKYTVQDEFDIEDSNGNDIIFKGVLVNAPLNVDGEIVLTPAAVISLTLDSDDDLVLYTVTATTSEKGRVGIDTPTGDDGLGFAPAGNFSVIDQYGAVTNIEIIDTDNSNAQVITIVKDGDDVKFATVKKGDVIAFSSNGDYIVVTPIAVVK